MSDYVEIFRSLFSLGFSFLDTPMFGLGFTFQQFLIGLIVATIGIRVLYRAINRAAANMPSESMSEVVNLDTGRITTTRSIRSRGVTRSTVSSRKG